MDQNLQQKLERALAAVQSDQVQAAMTLFQQILSEEPNQSDALHGLGLAYAQQRDYQQALQYFKEAVKFAPHVAPFHNNLANTYKILGKTEEAIRHYREALRLKSPYPEAHNNLGALLYKLGRFQEAAEHFQKSIRMDPFAVDTHYNLANCYVQLERYLDAATHYEEVLKLRPDHLGALHNLGITYCLLKRFEPAKPLLEQVVKREPQNIDALFHLGVIHSALAEPEAAKDIYLQVLAINPQHAASHHNLATVYLHLSDRQKALEHYQQAAILQPENKTALHMIAALTGKTQAQGAPFEYTQALFDQYAYNYDEHVRSHLKYQVPHLLRQLITPFVNMAQPIEFAADLGCGTGLCAPLFADIVVRLIGVDLSPNMIEIAKQRGGYYKLYVNDIVSFLKRYNKDFNLIIAADVFVYFGVLDSVFADCAAALKPGGLFVFSIEIIQSVEPLDPHTQFILRSTGRYAHQAAYIEQLANTYSFTIESQLTETLRYQDGEPVSGNLYVLRRKSEDKS